MRKWGELPKSMQTEAVKTYYDILNQCRTSLRIKRIFDIVLSILLIILLMPFLILISIIIKSDSKGPVFFRQTRVTQYGRKFRIFKFRTMVNDAESLGAQVTTDHDARVTRCGEVLRKYRLDEFPQLFNILSGDMTFVGTRPEVVKYVQHYTDEMKATLLLPAGITSIASITYKDEAKLLSSAENADEVYINKVLPEKMEYNLMAIRDFSFCQDIKTMILTFIKVVN